MAFDAYNENKVYLEILANVQKGRLNHALHLATKEGDTEIVDALCEAGADPNSVERDEINILGFTSVLTAALLQYPETFAALVKHGGDTSKKTIHDDGVEMLKATQQSRLRLKSNDTPQVRAHILSTLESQQCKPTHASACFSSPAP